VWLQGVVTEYSYLVW